MRRSNLHPSNFYRHEPAIARTFLALIVATIWAAFWAVSTGADSVALALAVPVAPGSAGRMEYLRNLASGHVTGAHGIMRRNITSLFWEARDAERERGLEWYDRAYSWADRTAREFDKRTLIVAHVISALSPLNVWEENLRDALRLLKRDAANDGPTGLTVCTFRQQKQKAWHIATYGSAKPQSGNKTENFAVNIGRPWRDGPVTVDRHARDAALHAPEGADDVSLTDLRYENISEAYRGARDVLQAQGYPHVRAHEVQAVVWIVWRRKHGGNRRFVRGRDGQPSLFPPIHPAGE